MIEFKNALKFKSGWLRRGDPCRFDGFEGFYVGSYKKPDEDWMHMICIMHIPLGEMVVSTKDSDRIICHQKMRKVEEGQMALC